MVEPLPPRQKYIHEDDELILEDGQSRAKLVGNLPLNDIVTGNIHKLLYRISTIPINHYSDRN